MAETTTRYPLGALEAFVVEVLVRHDVTRPDATVVAARMLEADLRGMSGHGIFRLPAYCQRITHGGYNLRPNIRTVRETPVSALVDGDNGFGQLVMTHAAEIAAEKAAEQGLAWVGVRGPNHAGAAGVYASMGLGRDLIGLYLAVGNANHAPPWGGVELLTSTNPIAVAIPTGEQPAVILDMATTVASYGRIKVAAERGETLPEGWMVDRRGAPLTDPTHASEGFLLPIGGYKGYGLGLVIGCLAGVLNGAALGSGVVDFSRDHTTPTNTGQMLLMVRPDLFRPLDEFKADMDARVRELRESTPMEGHPPVRTPGDRHAERVDEMTASGIPLAHETATRLADLAATVGYLDHPFVASPQPVTACRDRSELMHEPDQLHGRRPGTVAGVGRLGRILVVRLGPGEDLLLAMARLLADAGIETGILLGGVASLARATVRNIHRFPDRFPVTGEDRHVTTVAGPLEVISLQGNVVPGEDGAPVIHCHVEFSVGTPPAVTYGGHLVEGTIVGTTGELFVAELTGLDVRRRLDPVTLAPEIAVHLSLGADGGVPGPG